MAGGADECVRQVDRAQLEGVVTRRALERTVGATADGYRSCQRRREVHLCRVAVRQNAIRVAAGRGAVRPRDLAGTVARRAVLLVLVQLGHALALERDHAAGVMAATRQAARLVDRDRVDDIDVAVHRRTRGRAVATPLNTPEVPRIERVAWTRMAGPAVGRALHCDVQVAEPEAMTFRTRVRAEADARDLHVGRRRRRRVVHRVVVRDVTVAPGAVGVAGADRRDHHAVGRLVAGGAGEAVATMLGEERRDVATRAVRAEDGSRVERGGLSPVRHSPPSSGAVAQRAGRAHVVVVLVAGMTARTVGVTAAHRRVGLDVVAPRAARGVVRGVVDGERDDARRVVRERIGRNDAQDARGEARGGRRAVDPRVPRHDPGVVRDRDKDRGRQGRYGRAVSRRRGADRRRGPDRERPAGTQRSAAHVLDRDGHGLRAVRESGRVAAQRGLGRTGRVGDPIPVGRPDPGRRILGLAVAPVAPGGPYVGHGRLLGDAGDLHLGAVRIQFRGEEDVDRDLGGRQVDRPDGFLVRPRGSVCERRRRDDSDRVGLPPPRRL